jgi:hypothetical protein
MTDTPIIVDASPIPAQVRSFVGQLAAVMLFMPTLFAALKSQDVARIAAVLQSEPGIAAISIIVGAAIIVWRQLAVRRTQAQLRALANAVPDAIAQVRQAELSSRLLGLILLAFMLPAMGLLAGCTTLKASPTDCLRAAKALEDAERLVSIARVVQAQACPLPPAAPVG